MKGEPFLREIKEVYTGLINRHIADPEQHSKVFDKNSVYLPTKRKSARTIPKRTKSKPTMPQGRNGKSKGWLPSLFCSIISKAKDFLQNLIREHDMPPKPVLEIDMAEFRHMQNLMVKAQDKAKEIRHLQDMVLPKLKQQLADTKGIFKGKERKALTEQIQRTEKEIAEKLDKLPDVLKEDGYPDVQAFMASYRKAEAAVEQYNRDLAAWERQVREKQEPTHKEHAKPPERESVLKRLRQIQAEGRQRNQPRQRKKSFDRDSR